MLVLVLLVELLEMLVLQRRAKAMGLGVQEKWQADINEI